MAWVCAVSLNENTGTEGPGLGWLDDDRQVVVVEEKGYGDRRLAGRLVI